MANENDNLNDILSSPKQYVRANKRKNACKNHGVMTSAEALSTSMAKEEEKKKKVSKSEMRNRIRNMKTENKPLRRSNRKK
ncbi:CLUMA_CG002568, isoform A [Clunio marinus]|uniref:CLUMA_CG002568, isoform A n=1 Tax=Clunio marinus TaxID=568069 RepID=A0A1J1HLP1_9DIPT|nr:CLUMA_CG002568, isoform A [Clunio marinus]